MKEFNTDKIWLTSINTILIILLLIFIVSLLIFVKETTYQEIELTKTSFDALINKLENSIKIIAGIIAVLTIKVYFLNMRKTDSIIERTNRQLIAYVKNENLKNYFLHRKEFREYFSEIDLFKDPKNTQNLNFYAIWDSIYRAFYYSGYKNFEPSLSNSSKKSVIDFFNAVKNSSINYQEAPIIEKDELYKIQNTIIPSLEPIINQIRDNKMLDKKFKDQAKDLIQLIFTIKIMQELYESVLSFDGENSAHEYFKFNKNIHEYFDINTIQ